MVKNIAVVVPTIRKESIDKFLDEWRDIFAKHEVEVILVIDGKDQHILHNGERKNLKSDLVSKFCAGSRQLGFLYIAKNLPEIEYIFTTDDDCFPVGDPIQDHIDQLKRKVPISWISTASDYMRGYPYKVREEAQVHLSHGIWSGVYDWDAPSQLLKGKTEVTFPKMPIPKGIYYPMCGMNLAFSRQALPYVFFAPVGTFKGAERFDDIYAGIMLVKDFAILNWAMVTGYAEVEHLRASNVFNSLEHEAVGIKHNEEFWKDPDNYDGDPFFAEFRKKREKWYNLVKGIEKR